jgi:hypothetical protein
MLVDAIRADIGDVEDPFDNCPDCQKPHQDDGRQMSFQEGCLWADESRRDTFKGTYEYHFINVSNAFTTLDLARDCAALDCAVVGIQRYARYIALATQRQQPAVRVRGLHTTGTTSLLQSEHTAPILRVHDAISITKRRRVVIVEHERAVMMIEVVEPLLPTDWPKRRRSRKIEADTSPAVDDVDRLRPRRCCLARRRFRLTCLGPLSDDIVLACKNGIRKGVHELGHEIDALNPSVLWKRLTMDCHIGPPLR